MPKPFKIEQNVPVPPTSNARFPWAGMAPGDSFFVPTSRASALRVQKNLSNSGKVYCTKHRPDLRVSVRQVEGGVRAWLLNKTKTAVVAIERGRRA